MPIPIHLEIFSFCKLSLVMAAARKVHDSNFHNKINKNLTKKINSHIVAMSPFERLVGHLESVQATIHHQSVSK